MTTKIIHFDSINSVNNPVTVLDQVTSNLISTYHSFNTNYSLPSQIKQMTRIKLKSLELPLTFSNIRNNMSPFSFTYTNLKGINETKTFTQALPEAIYTDIYEVVTALNTFMTTSSGLSVLLAPGETIPVFSVTTINRDLRICYTMQIYPSSSFTLNETFLTKTLLGYVKTSDNLPVTTTTRSFKGGVYSTDAQIANYTTLNNSVTMRNDITTASTENLIQTYIPSVSTALIIQMSFLYSLTNLSYGIIGETTLYSYGVTNELQVPSFLEGIDEFNLSGNLNLMNYSYKISMDPIMGPLMSLTDIFAPNTYITTINRRSQVSNSKFYAAIGLSLPLIKNLVSGVSTNYPIKIIATNLLLSTTTFSNPFNINYDTYLNMTLHNLPIVTTNNNKFPCTFKIPLDSQGNIVYLNGESNSFIQEANIDNSHFVLDKITVIFTDRRGLSIQPNYGNHSFSLSFEFDGKGNNSTGTAGTPSFITNPVAEPEHYFQEYM